MFEAFTLMIHGFKKSFYPTQALCKEEEDKVLLHQPEEHATSAVATGCPGGGSPAPLTVAWAPPFWFTQDTVFGTSRNDKTTSNDGKRSN